MTMLFNTHSSGPFIARYKLMAYLYFLAFLSAIMVHMAAATIVYSGTQTNMLVYTTYMGSECTGTPFSFVYTSGECFLDTTGATCTTGDSCALYYTTAGSSNPAALQSYTERFEGSTCSGDAIEVTAPVNIGETTTCDTSAAPYNTQYTTSAAIPSEFAGATVSYYPNSECNGVPHSTAVYPLDTCFEVSSSMSGMTLCADTTCALSLYADAQCKGTSSQTDPIAGGYTISANCVVDPNGSTWEGNAVYVKMAVSTLAPTSSPTKAPVLSQTGFILVVFFAALVALVLLGVTFYSTVYAVCSEASNMREVTPLMSAL